MEDWFLNEVINAGRRSGIFSLPAYRNLPFEILPRVDLLYFIDFHDSICILPYAAACLFALGGGLGSPSFIL